MNPEPTDAQRADAFQRRAVLAESLLAAFSTRHREFLTQKTIHHLEKVIRRKNRKIKALQRWKAEATMVESEWNPQAVGNLIGVGLGQSIRPAIEPAIRALLNEVMESRLGSVAIDNRCDCTAFSNCPEHSDPPIQDLTNQGLIRPDSEGFWWTFRRWKWEIYQAKITRWGDDERVLCITTGGCWTPCDAINKSKDVGQRYYKATPPMRPGEKPSSGEMAFRDLAEIRDALWAGMDDIGEHLQVAKYNLRGECCGDVLPPPNPPQLIHEAGIKASEEVKERLRLAACKISAIINPPIQTRQIGTVPDDSPRLPAAQYAGQVPCEKCGAKHWMHGPCAPLIQTRQMGEVAIATDGTRAAIGTTEDEARKGVADAIMSLRLEGLRKEEVRKAATDAQFEQLHAPGGPEEWSYAPIVPAHVFEDAIKPSPRQGWREFECDECGLGWGQATRDCHSPSGEDCPKCGTWIFPCGSRLDPSLEVDAMGNLADPNRIKEDHEGNKAVAKKAAEYARPPRDLCNVLSSMMHRIPLIPVGSPHDELWHELNVIKKSNLYLAPEAQEWKHTARTLAKYLEGRTEPWVETILKIWRDEA